MDYKKGKKHIYIRVDKGEIILQIAEERIGRMFDAGIGIDVWKLS